VETNIDVASGILAGNCDDFSGKDDRGVARHLLQFDRGCSGDLSLTDHGETEKRSYYSQIPAHKTLRPYLLTFVTGEMGPGWCPEFGQG
jgi:hypothetical protein